MPRWGPRLDGRPTGNLFSLSIVYRSTHEASQERPAAGHPRPADPPHPGVGRHARLGHLATAAADFPGCPAGEPGLALSRALSPRATGLDRIVVGRLGEQPACEVLRADAVGPE